MKIIESTSPIKIDSIEKFNEAFGEQSEIAAIALSLAIARHVLLRETLPRGDANEYQKAANAFASVVESYGIAGASLGTNYRGWPSRLYIARDLRSYYLPIGKPAWEMLAREILNRDVKVDNVIIETEEKNEKEENATKLEYEATPNPDNDEYDDEVVGDLKYQVQVVDPPSEVVIIDESTPEANEEDESPTSIDETSIACRPLVGGLPNTVASDASGEHGNRLNKETEIAAESFERDSLGVTNVDSIIAAIEKRAETVGDMLACLRAIDRDALVYLFYWSRTRDGRRFERLFVSDDPCWTSEDVCYLNDATAPINLNRELLTVGDLVDELERHDSDEDVYCFDAITTFAGLSRPCVTTLCDLGVMGAISETGVKVIMRIIDPREMN